MSSVLADPTLELRDSNGTLLISNNDWQDNPAQAALITAAGLAPSNNLESAIAATLPPGLYTALLAGLNNTTGNGSGGSLRPRSLKVADRCLRRLQHRPEAHRRRVWLHHLGQVLHLGRVPHRADADTDAAAGFTNADPSRRTCTENFDTVTAPALPSGWTASKRLAAR